MSDHDPLCSRRRHDDEPDHYECAIGCTQIECDCDWIARVREDERSGLPAVMFGNGDEKAVAQIWDAGYAAAIRDAVEAVKATPLSSRGYLLAVAAIEALGGER